MRKIEQAMNGAIALGINWASGNTTVTYDDTTGTSAVYLHGNHIADVTEGRVEVDVDTLKDYPTNTTKSRLRALGADVCTRGGVVYLERVAL
jgi:hypothetical protein